MVQWQVEVAAVPTIRVDDEVYELLQRRAKPFVDTPNSVLRRELGLRPSEGAKVAAAGSSGELAPLVAAGLLRSGEELVWRRRQSVHHATVTDDGCISLEDGRRFDTPSGAARALSGYEVNGWRNWGRARDGVRLSSLRDQL
ncbi:hypothetical protein [Micromonospora aurantiaca (nom. illeg.)]|uniref:restriction system modified-DNA reader domain-containing protein n=1 Tax=Micromonospora aurantiaca (nom. illeg.) TaxID=47850 RepID=UPI003F49F1D0